MSPARTRFAGAFAAALVAVLLLAVPGRAERPAPTPLRVVVETPRGGTTSERVVTVRGRVEGLPSGRATLVLNGTPLSVGIERGAFELPVVLAPGLNTLSAVARRDGVDAQDEVALYATVPAKDLRITLTWDTPGSDVDLWVTVPHPTKPEGELVNYSHRQSLAGGTLDTDVTTGYGPETFTQAHLVRGTFRVRAHAYRLDRPARIEVTTVRFEGTPEEERRVFRGVLLRTDDVLEVGDILGSQP